MSSTYPDIDQSTEMTTYSYVSIQCFVPPLPTDMFCSIRSIRRGDLV